MTSFNKTNKWNARKLYTIYQKLSNSGFPILYINLRKPTPLTLHSLLQPLEYHQGLHKFQLLHCLTPKSITNFLAIRSMHESREPIISKSANKPTNHSILKITYEVIFQSNTKEQCDSSPKTATAKRYDEEATS